MKTYKFIIAFLFLASLVSCQDFFDTSIELDIPAHESKLAITTFISNTDAADKVLVSYSIGGLEEAEGNQLINDATITITNGTVVETFSITSEDGIYELDNPLTFTPNTDYTLAVDAAGYPSVSATQKYPKTTEIIAASVADGTVKVTFKDLPDQNDYYYLKAEYFKYGVWNTLSIQSFGSTSERAELLDHAIIFNDAFFNGDEYEITATHNTSISDTDTDFRVKLYHLTEDFYRYDRSRNLARQTDNENPFVEPVILHRNIENGYGIFAMMNETVFTFEME